MQVKFNRGFAKQYDKSPNKIKTAFNKRLHIFLQNQNHQLLNNHYLIGKWLGYKSINITGDWRAIYQEFIRDNENLIIFIALGTHSQLYK